MDTFAVMAEVATALRTIAGLRVYEWEIGAVSTPAVVISLPETIEFDKTYARGQDKLSDVVVMLLLGKGDIRSAQTALGPFIKGSGAKSFKQVLEAYAYTTCHRVVVTTVDFEAVERAEVPYLGAMFHLDIYGSGS